MGCHLTRTGRPFFADPALSAILLERMAGALHRAGFWDRFDTGWICLDAELLPWSAKARELIDTQYAPLGAAATMGLRAATGLLGQAASRGVESHALLERTRLRLDAASAFDAVWQRYAWDVNSIDDLRLAPFHLLASEGVVHDTQDHAWHMSAIAEFCAADPKLLLATPWRAIDLEDAEATGDAVRWWEEQTAAGSEGMVVKPRAFVPRGSRGIIQPALKCRGREYLRIIYGPEYTLPGQLERLRSRSLGGNGALR